MTDIRSISRRKSEQQYHIGSEMATARASRPGRRKRSLSRRAPICLEWLAPRGVAQDLHPAPPACDRVSSLCRETLPRQSRMRTLDAPSAVTLEGTACLVRRAMLSKGSGHSSLRLSALCLRCKGCTSENRGWVVRKLWVVEICCGKVRKRGRKLVSSQLSPQPVWGLFQRCTQLASVHERNGDISTVRGANSHGIPVKSNRQ
jgi:hypothetical protein